MHVAQPIAKNALIILINLSNDDEVIRCLAEDNALLETLLRKITVCQWPMLDPGSPDEYSHELGCQGLHSQ